MYPTVAKISVSSPIRKISVIQIILIISAYFMCYNNMNVIITTNDQ